MCCISAIDLAVGGSMFQLVLQLVGGLTPAECPVTTSSRDHNKGGRLLLIGFNSNRLLLIGFIGGSQAVSSPSGPDWPTVGSLKLTPGPSSMVSRESPANRGVKPSLKLFCWAPAWKIGR